MSTDPFVVTAIHDLPSVKDEHAANVDIERRSIHNALRDLRSNTLTIRQSLDRLDDAPGGLYDVELVDTRGTAVARTALDQIEVAIAALTAVVPKPGA